MKSLLYKVAVFVFIIAATSCSQDANVAGSSNSVTGKGGSLAVFAIKGDYLYTVDNNKLSVFNVREASKPAKVNDVSIGFDIETLFSFEDYLFIGSRNAMYIYSVTNPEFPKKLSQSNHFRACDPVVSDGKNAYVTISSGRNCGGSVNQLLTYDVTDVTNPKLLNTRNLKKPKGLSLFGKNYLLVCDDDVKIFDVSDPKNSKYLKSIPIKYANDVVIIKNHLFIISDKSIDQYELNENDIKNFKKISTFSF